MADYVLVSGELRHAGVKGMKWGVRRYQNKDGSLTPAGKKRYAKEEYKRADNAAFKRYEKTINSIEKNYKRGQNLSKKDMAREEAADRRYRAESSKAKAAYKQAKKDIKAEEKANAKKMEDELREAGYRNTTGYNANKHAKNAISSGVSALGVAVIGSAATNALAKKGQSAAAERVYNLSRQAFGTLAFSAQVSAGFAAVNGMMGGVKSMADYRKTEREIRAKYNK